MTYVLCVYIHTSRVRPYVILCATLMHFKNEVTCGFELIFSDNAFYYGVFGKAAMVHALR